MLVVMQTVTEPIVVQTDDRASPVVIVPSTRVFTKSDKHETSAYEYLHRTGQLQSYRPGMCAVLFTELSLYNPIVLISIRGSDRVA